ncbi:MAG: UvrD-helicase domain-containing protein [Bacilli bacterium]|nr:UvrD-helicase domain-containing protein [Bacilli bacterium]
MEYKYIDNNYYLNNKTSLFNNFKLKKQIKNNNKKFVNNLFNIDYKVNSISLDNNQKEAVFTNEVNTLVLAGAGSGKTLTIVGKINYLVNELNINPKEILCISFTNDTVNNLKEKISSEIDVFTFHKLALEIIYDYKKNLIIVSNYLEYIINEIFLSIVGNIDEKILKSFNKTISSFINLFKNYNYDYSYFNKLLKKNNSKILELIRIIYLIYDDELKSTNYIDFNDMINISIKLISERGLKRYYKYIIIDEFQDISENRYRLIKAIKDSCNSKIFAVGDDFQSIYKFAGSNLNMITNFKKYFGYTKIIKIVNTYRNSNELVTVASNFIMKNKKQIKKDLVSNKHSYKPIKIIYYSKNEIIKFKKILDMVNGNILILGRNNYDLNSVLDDEIKYDNKIIYCGKEYEFKTVHKSKGLEEENVIILNMSDNTYGFPNKKKDDITKILLPKDKYLYEEERRLFYVALTRTKNNVYIFVDKEKPSIFIKELIRKSKKNIEVLDL